MAANVVAGGALETEPPPAHAASETPRKASRVRAVRPGRRAKRAAVEGPIGRLLPPGDPSRYRIRWDFAGPQLLVHREVREGQYRVECAPDDRGSSPPTEPPSPLREREPATHRRHRGDGDAHVRLALHRELPVGDRRDHGARLVPREPAEPRGRCPRGQGQRHRGDRLHRAPCARCAIRRVQRPPRIAPRDRPRHPAAHAPPRGLSLARPPLQLAAPPGGGTDQAALPAQERGLGDRLSPHVFRLPPRRRRHAARARHRMAHDRPQRRVLLPLRALLRGHLRPPRRPRRRLRRDLHLPGRARRERIRADHRRAVHRRHDGPRPRVCGARGSVEDRRHGRRPAPPGPPVQAVARARDHLGRLHPVDVDRRRAPRGVPRLGACRASRESEAEAKCGRSS